MYGGIFTLVTMSNDSVLLVNTFVVNIKTTVAGENFAALVTTELDMFMFTHDVSLHVVAVFGLIVASVA